MRSKTLLWVGLFLINSSSTYADPKDSVESIDGTYQFKEISQSGMVVPAEQLKHVSEVLVAGGKLFVRLPTKEDVTSFKLDPSKSPHQIDLAVPGIPGLTHPGIYQFENDTLTIVWAVGADRPTSFDGKAERQMKFVLARKSKDASPPPAARDVLRLGEFEGFWHDKVKFSIQEVHENGTFDGIGEFTGGRYAGLKFGISGRVGKEGVLTITRHVSGEVQVAQTTAPKLKEDGVREWTGQINGIGLPPNGVTPFRLIVPKK